MNPTQPSADPRGSLWHRWDPHLHAPGTLWNDQFKGDWEAYLQRVEKSSPTIRALGVTDYFCIETYRAVRARKQMGRLPQVDFLFPNVELRLDIKTESGSPLNIHLLFSPDDPQHEAEIQRILNELTFRFEGDRLYHCSLSELEALGRRLDSKVIDAHAARRTGAHQFKVKLDQLRDLFRERWMRLNCLVGISGGADGTSGLQRDDSFKLIRRNIEHFADVVFTSNVRQRDFWLGKLDGFSKQDIESTYRFLKPCLHGSDAHGAATVGVPTQERNCWIKGNLCFESLRQAVLEPDTRVAIGPQNPDHATSPCVIKAISTAGTPWLKNDRVELNSGLVAIIGARGSGKTALADLIACGAGVHGTQQDPSSFLYRAAEHVTDACVTVEWADGTAKTFELQSFVDESWDAPPEEVRYLSQHFVEKLCSEAGLATQLREALEQVVFDNTPERYETTSFQELSDLLLDPIRRRRADLQRAITEATEQVVREDLLIAQLPGLRRDRDALQKQLENTQRTLSSLLPKGSDQRVQRLAELESSVVAANARVEELRRKLKTIQDLSAETTHISSTPEPRRLREMRLRFASAGLTDAEWRAFEMTFSGDVRRITEQSAASVNRALALAISGPSSPGQSFAAGPLNTWPLTAVTAERDAARKAVGIDRDRLKRYEEQRRLLTQQQTSLARFDEQIRQADGATTRRASLLESRRTLYADVFEEFANEEAVLRQLYEPLDRQLAGKQGALANLRFVVQRRVESKRWADTGEKPLDLRLASALKGQGSLLKKTTPYLDPAWRTGAAAEVAGAMERFREDLWEQIKRSMATVGAAERAEAYRQLAVWLYDTAHISVEYAIQYEGVAIERLSPGTRGIVLLLLYLAVDQQDLRPLIIDQPEENLDPNSVFTELVPHFREACQRRQVIIVTHNANLVVNTDADQVIIASSSRSEPSVLPSIQYTSGALESEPIRRGVCKTLEGGERAFLERDRRYRLRWGQDLLVHEA